MGITSFASNVTNVEHEGIFIIELAICISNIILSCLQPLGVFNGIYE
jgi:hypothetical protein